MFLIDWFIFVVIFVSLVMFLLVKVIVIFLVVISVVYWWVRVLLVLVRMCMKLFLVSVCSLMWIGRWFCNLGKRFEGLVIWNVFEVMKRMWLVFIGLCLVDIVVFLIKGSRLCCMFLWLMLLLCVLEWV